MKTNEVAIVELQLSTDQVEANTNKITTSIEDLILKRFSTVSSIFLLISVFIAPSECWIPVIPAPIVSLILFNDNFKSLRLTAIILHFFHLSN